MLYNEDKRRMVVAKAAEVVDELLESAGRKGLREDLITHEWKYMNCLGIWAKAHRGQIKKRTDTAGWMNMAWRRYTPRLQQWLEMKIWKAKLGLPTPQRETNSRVEVTQAHSK